MADSKEAHEHNIFEGKANGGFNESKVSKKLVLWRLSIAK